MTNLSDFDLDFSYGKEGENLVEALLGGGKTVEVKRDRKWHQTGNLYIETECWYLKSNSWEPSGLSVTKADYWAFVLERGVILVPLDILKLVVKAWGREITCEIPPNRSKGYLIMAHDLLTGMKIWREEPTDAVSRFIDGTL